MQDTEKNYENLLDEDKLTQEDGGKIENTLIEDDNDEVESDNTGSESAFDEVKDRLTHLEQLKKENDRLKRHTYAQAEQIRKEKEEVNRLAQLFSNSFDSNIASVEQKLFSDIEQTKLEAASYIDENGSITNPTEYQNANAKLMRLQSEVVQFENWKENEAPKHKHIQTDTLEGSVEPELPPIREQALHEWLKSSPELDAGSYSFNPELAENIAIYGRAIDEELHKNRQSHLIGSPHYLAKLDEIMHALKRQMPHTGASNQLKMRSSPNSYAPAGTTPVGTRRGKSQQLNANELEFAKAIGVSPKAFAEA